MKQSFDDIIREKTKGYEAPVPADAWDNIVSGKKKKRRFVFAWWMLALLGGGAVVLYNYSNKDTAVNKEQTISRQSNPANNSSATGDTETITAQGTNNTNVAANSDNNVAENNPAPAETSASPGNSTTGNTTARFDIQTGNPGKSKRQTTNNEDGFDISNNNPAKRKKIKTGNDGNVINNSVSQDQSTITVTTADAGKKATITDQPVINSNTTAGIATAGSNNEIKNNRKDTASAADSQQTVAETAAIRLKKRTGNWKLDIAVTPLVSLQQNSPLQELKRTSTEGMVKREFIAGKTETSIEPGIAFNLALRKKLNAKTYIGAGIQYATFKEKVFLSGTETVTTSSIVKRLEKDNNGISYLVDDTVETITTGQRTIRALNSYQTISLPVFIQTNLVQKRSYNIDLSAGIYFNLLRSYQNSINGTFTNTYTTGLKQGTSQTATGVDIFTSLRFSAPLRKKWSLFAEPMLRYSFLRNNTRNMINAKYIHQAGVSLGITRSF